jgi:hypothetical protein
MLCPMYFNNPRHSSKIKRSSPCERTETTATTSIKNCPIHRRSCKRQEARICSPLPSPKKAKCEEEGCQAASLDGPFTKEEIDHFPKLQYYQVGRVFQKLPRGYAPQYTGDPAKDKKPPFTKEEIDHFPKLQYY